MSETFTASNGWLIDEDGYIRRDSQHGWVVGAFDVDAVRQFFTELRDHELGRWRDTVNPDYVVYPRGEGGVRVVDEKTGMSDVIYRDSHVRGINPSRWHVARHYFETHPAHKPLPTEPGMYVHARDAREFPQSTAVLVCARDGSWYEYGEAQKTAKAIAQCWHDAGELVRLVPEGGGDE